MSINQSILWLSDLDEIISNLPELELLSNKYVMITGCTGLICSAVVDILIRWNVNHDIPIKILAAGRNTQRIHNRFAPYDKQDWFQIVSFDATSVNNHLDKTCDYIIHGASNASPNNIIKEPVETILSNTLGLKYLLDYTKDCQSTRILYISSSEVYGEKRGNEPFKTNEYGYIDILNPRNSYSIGKRAAETLCISYINEYSVNSVIVRPGHIYGPTALPSDNRVSSSWSYSVARHEDIVMKSEGSQLRSYCYCLDCASAIITVLLKGITGHAYNISNPDSIITIREMAEILAQCGGVNLRFEQPTEIEKTGFNPMTNSSLDSTDLLALGWTGLFNANRGFAHTVSILKTILD